MSKNIFRKKKKDNTLPVTDIVPDTFPKEFSGLGMMSNHRRIRHYPYGISDEEREKLKEKCEAIGYKYVEINTIEINDT